MSYRARFDNGMDATSSDVHKFVNAVYQLLDRMRHNIDLDRTE